MSEVIRSEQLFDILMPVRILWEANFAQNKVVRRVIASVSHNEVLLQRDFGSPPESHMVLYNLFLTEEEAWDYLEKCKRESLNEVVARRHQGK